MEDHLNNAEKLPAYVEDRGVSGIEEFFRERLAKWKDVEINIGITGDSGTGKSSFINVIRGLKDSDPKAARVGVAETTTVPHSFPHPTNEKIKFWDLPGICAPNYPDLETYCEKVKLETYDTFLILTAGRFTQNDLELAKKIKSVDKKFFFIRTKIDQSEEDEKERLEESFNEEIMLAQIRRDCSENLSGLVEKELDIFLISNRYPTKWEFGRLTQSILDVLPIRQQEALTLSLSVLTSMSADILKRKVKVLRSRVWKVSAASAAVALVAHPDLSVAVDLTLITNEVSFYRSQLGLPEEGSAVFLTADNQERVGRFFLMTTKQIGGFVTEYFSESVVEEFTRFIPFVGRVIANGMSFGTTYCFLHRCLTEMEKTALSLLEEITARF